MSRPHQRRLQRTFQSRSEPLLEPPVHSVASAADVGADAAVLMQADNPTLLIAVIVASCFVFVCI